MQQLEKRYSCPELNCNYVTNKLSNLSRHRKRHSKPTAACGSANHSDGEWARTDPGNLSDILPGDAEVSDCDSCNQTATTESNQDFLSGRTVRKPTKPSQVYAPPRRPVLSIPSISESTCIASMTDEVEAESDLRNDSAATYELPPRSNPSSVPPLIPLGRLQPYQNTTRNTSDASAQTQETKCKKRRTSWTIKRWSEGDIQVEQVEMVEEDIE